MVDLRPPNVTPSPQSLAFRANLAKLVSPLRRVRPRVPFFQLAAHRVPTLWGLYRSLLRDAGSENVSLPGWFAERCPLTAAVVKVRFDFGSGCCLGRTSI